MWESQKHYCATQKTPGYCWPSPKYRNWCAQHAFLEGQKAEQTSSRKSTPRMLKGVDQQYRGGFVKQPAWIPASAGSAGERLRPPVGSVWARLAPSSIGGKSRCSDVVHAAWAHLHTRCAPSAGPRVPRAPTPRQGGSHCRLCPSDSRDTTYRYALVLCPVTGGGDTDWRASSGAV